VEIGDEGEDDGDFDEDGTSTTSLLLIAVGAGGLLIIVIVVLIVTVSARLGQSMSSLRPRGGTLSRLLECGGTSIPGLQTLFSVPQDPQSWVKIE
jgi:hypothetical protein